MESTIRRLNQAGYITPLARYFLIRMRHLLTKCKKHGKQKIPQAVKDDLELRMKYLGKTTTKGVDINNITFTEKT